VPLLRYPLAMAAPRWLDERGPVSPEAAVSDCGREIAVVTLPSEHLRFWGWRPQQISSYVEWCGHRVDGIPVPGEDGRWRLIVVEGDAT
jgi:hypothetical protein